MSSKVTLAIADNQPIFRYGLVNLLSSFPNFKILFEAVSSTELLRMLTMKTPEVLILVFNTPSQTDLAIFSTLVVKFPTLKIIFIVQSLETKIPVHFFTVAASAFLLTKDPISEIVNAIKTLKQNTCYYNKSSALIIKNALFDDDADNLKIPNIKVTPREYKVLELICAYKSNNEIAKELRISPRTAEWHRSKLLSKTSSKNTMVLIFWANLYFLRQRL